MSETGTDNNSGVSILPRLATGIAIRPMIFHLMKFLFFPVLRRGSYLSTVHSIVPSFYSSPSCDGDLVCLSCLLHDPVSILPRLATGIASFCPICDPGGFYSSPSCDGDLCVGVSSPSMVVSILPRLATGIFSVQEKLSGFRFLFFPVLRRGSEAVLHLIRWECFYSSPSCDGDQCNTASVCIFSVSILPRLATGIPNPLISGVSSDCFYSSPSCDGDQSGQNVPH